PSGLVTLAAGANLHVNAAGTNAARFFVNDGATLTFNASYTQAAGSRIEGPGAMLRAQERQQPQQQAAPATLVFAGGVQTFVGNVVLDIATTNSAATLEVGGTL